MMSKQEHTTIFVMQPFPEELWSALQPDVPNTPLDLFLVNPDDLYDGAIVPDSLRNGAILLYVPIFDQDEQDRLSDLLARAPQLPIIAVTGEADDQTIHRTISAGVQACLPQTSFTPERLIDVACRAVRQFVRQDVPYAQWRGLRDSITALRDAERAAFEQTLQQSEARFRAVFADAPVGMMLVEPDGKLVNSNAALQHMLGYTGEELAQLSFENITHPDELPRNRRYFRELIAGQRDQYQLEKRYMHRSGEPVWVRVTAYLVSSLPGTTRLILAMAEDITQRKLAEQAEHEQRVLAEAMHDAAEAILMTLEIDEVLERLLTSVARVVPHDFANIMLIEDDAVQIVRWQDYRDASPLDDWLHSQRLPVAWFDNMREVIDSGEPLVIADTLQASTWVNIPETSWIRSHIMVPLRRQGTVFGFLNLDSTLPDAFTPRHARLLQAFADQAAIAIWNAQLYDAERRHAAELEARVAQRTLELAQERAQLAAILDAMDEGVIFLDDAQHVLYTNRAFAKLLGFDGSDTPETPGKLYRHALATLNADIDWDQEIGEALNQDVVWRREISMERLDGTTLDAALTVNAVRGPKGVPVGYVGILRNVSQEKALREQKDRFIANASHELRTPITNVRMRLHLLHKDPAHLPEHLRVLNLIVERMETLVDDLLDLSRFERGTILLDREPVALQRLIERVILVQQPHADAKSIALSVHLPDEPLVVHADADRLIQVLTNLVTNALHYTPENGQVEVRLSVEHSEDGPQAAISVRDTGIGIPPDQLAHIFEPFFRATHSGGKGAGLGLTISKEIIDLHDGTLGATSHFGQGSTFTIRLALSDQAAEQPHYTG